MVMSKNVANRSGVTSPSMCGKFQATGRPQIIIILSGNRWKGFQGKKSKVKVTAN